MNQEQPPEPKPYSTPLIDELAAASMTVTPQYARTPGSIMAEMLSQQMKTGAHDPALEKEMRQASQNFFNGKGVRVVFENFDTEE